MYPIDFFYRTALGHSRNLALEHPAGRFSFAELCAVVDAFAAALQALDSTPGGRVGICSANTVDHVIALLGCLAAEKVWIPLNPRSGQSELTAILALTEPGVIVCDDAHRAKLAGAETCFVRSAPRTDGPSGETVDDLLVLYAGQHPVRRYPPLETEQAIKFTSGSSGTPKGVLQSYRCWNTHCASIAHAFEFRADERFLCAAPITHGTSCFLLPVLLAGGAIVLPDGPRPDVLLAALAEADITATYMPPTMIYNLMAHPDVERSRYPNLRHLIYSGAPMRMAQMKQAMEIFNGALETAYGQAEAPQIISFMRARDFADDAKLGSVGYPGLLANIGILDDAGRPLPVGEMGEIAVRGDLLASGYLNDPSAQAAAFRDGWLLTGDLGLIDDGGLLYIKGRRKEVIISGGFNVYPRDVEDVLGRHPAVHECSVFGVEDEKWGEAVHAAVELNADARVSEADLIAFVKTHLDSVKAPKRLHIVDALPRNAVGKVVRRLAKDAVMGAAGRAGRRLAVDRARR